MDKKKKIEDALKWRKDYLNDLKDLMEVFNQKLEENDQNSAEHYALLKINPEKSDIDNRIYVMVEPAPGKGKTCHIADCTVALNLYEDDKAQWDAEYKILGTCNQWTDVLGHVSPDNDLGKISAKVNPYLDEAGLKEAIKAYYLSDPGLDDQQKDISVSGLDDAAEKVQAVLKRQIEALRGGLDL